MQTTTDKWLTAAPVMILGAALVLLFFCPVPDANKELALSIVSGFLGFLARQHMPQKDAAQ